MTDKNHKCFIYKVDWANKTCIDIEVISTPSSEMPEEALLFAKIFENGNTVTLNFLSNHPLNKCPSLSSPSGVTSLRWSAKYSIPDFGFDSSGVFGTLSFSSKPIFVYISWESVVEIIGSDGTHGIWKEKIK